MGRELRGRNVLITGASRGIGRCVAERAARAGARLALAARSVPELDELAANLCAAGGVAWPFPTDLTDPAARARLVASAVEKLGGLDVLCNNAGVSSFGHFATSSEEVLRTIMEVNFFAPA